MTTQTDQPPSLPDLDQLSWRERAQVRRMVRLEKSAQKWEARRAGPPPPRHLHRAVITIVMMIMMAALLVLLLWPAQPTPLP